MKLTEAIKRLTNKRLQHVVPRIFTNIMPYQRFEVVEIPWDRVFEKAIGISSFGGNGWIQNVT